MVCHFIGEAQGKKALLGTWSLTELAQVGSHMYASAVLTEPSMWLLRDKARLRTVQREEEARVVTRRLRLLLWHWAQITSGSLPGAVWPALFFLLLCGE